MGTALISKLTVILVTAALHYPECQVSGVITTSKLPSDEKDHRRRIRAR